MDEELEVVKGYPSDEARGVVRLHQNTLDRLEIDPEDTVLIHGRRPTPAHAHRLDFVDPEGTARMDAFTRQNAAVTLGESISVQRADLPPAQTVVLSPLAEQAQDLDIGSESTNRTIIFEIPNRFTPPIEEEASLESKSEVLDVVRQRIAGRPVAPGDIVPARLDRMGLTTLLLTIEKTDRDGPVRITSETNVNIEAPT
ncbi:hypothetical protein [Haladaptatus halobius]|uniref:hypothetical protein n=1 Tax=Haladaptatus halobius TaxID=2884875 RepID=UPI001D0B301E|nr:hypothetical protein [Haladaptatus halobius]